MPPQGMPGPTTPGHPAMAPMQAQAGGAAPAKKGGGGLIIGIVLALVAIGGAAAAYFLFFAGPKSELSKKVPKDTEIFFEVPDIKNALGAFAGMSIVEAKELDGKKWEGEFKKGLKDAFEIKEDAAEDLLGSIKGIAIGSRGVTRKQQQVTLISFSSADGMEKLLKSERFSKEDDVGSGALYAVEPLKVDDPEEMKDWSAPKKMFARMSYDKKAKYNAFVWFQDAKLLAIGDREYIEDVSAVLGGSDSLASHENWGKAKFESGAQAIVYVSGDLVNNVDDDDIKRFTKGYFSEVAPFAGSLKLTDAGSLITMHGEMKGNKIGEEDQFASPVSLDIYEKLPAETIGYIAMSTKKKADGKELKKWFVKKVKSIDENLGDELDKNMDKMDEELGFKITDALDAVGDQMVLAAAVDRTLEYDKETKPEEYLDKVGVGYLVLVGNEDQAKKVVKKIKEKYFDEEGPLAKMYDVDDKGGGFVATPKEENSPVPEVRVIVEKEYVLVAAYGLAGRFEEAAKGKGKTLKDDDAHKRAIKSFSGSPRVLAWFDTGWVGEKALAFVNDDDKMKEELDEFEDETGISHKALVVKGANRITSAFAISIDTASDKWDLTVQGLNSEALSMAGALGVLIPRLSGGGPSPTRPVIEPGGTPPPSGGVTGVAECDALIAKLANCSAIPESTKTSITDALKQAAQMSPSAAAESCKQQMQSYTSLCP
jgi:hypothetical protein